MLQVLSISAEASLWRDIKGAQGHDQLELWKIVPDDEVTHLSDIMMIQISSEKWNYHEFFSREKLH